LVKESITLDSQEYVGFFNKQSKLSQISIDIYKSNQGHRKKMFLSFYPTCKVQVHTFDFYALFVFLFHAIVFLLIKNERLVVEIIANTTTRTLKH